MVMKHNNNHVGEKYGRLTIIEFIGRGKHSVPIYRCRCECGKEKRVNWWSLDCGRSKSCGCLKRDMAILRCQEVRMKRENNWRGGVGINRDGYKRIYINHSKSILEHRDIWERVNGSIPDGHDIHHLNGIRSDNRLENLSCVPKKRHGPYKILEPYQRRIKDLEDEIRRIKENAN